MLDLTESIRRNVSTAVQEDVGNGDITAQLIAPETRLEMQLLCREPAVLCGTEWFNEAFLQLDPNTHIDWSATDGDSLEADQTICRLNGNARAMLTAERTALNFLQTLSGTATITHYYQSLIAHTPCKILDTRKTIPNLRLAQKYAVHCGGGMNHRIGLFDAFLLKENHLAACGSMSAAVQQARKLHPELLLEVEVENIDQLEQAIASQVDRVLLDNFDVAMLRQAVGLNAGRLKLEASGNITEQNIAKMAETGIDFISIGALTKHVHAVDFSLRFS
jgi:nicotinate-nucleotide pyrophosphorylase (carboxylating)